MRNRYRLNQGARCVNGRTGTPGPAGFCSAMQNGNILRFPQGNQESGPNHNRWMLSRRRFLGGAVVSAVAGGAARAEDRLKLREFAYSQVKLTEGPLAAMYERTRAHFLKLDEDRLLKVYRQRVGMPAPGRDMGGWYDAEGFVPGHLLGQFISGLARLHANNLDPESAAKARRLVLGYAATFEKDNNPFAGQKAIATWACYVLDKYEIGLLDASTLAGVDEARTLLPRVIQGGLRFIPDHTFDRIGVRQPLTTSPMSSPRIYSRLMP